MSIDRGVADRLMQLLMANSESLNTATEVSDAIADDESRTRFRRALAEIMCANSSAIEQIGREHPELHPYRNEAWFRALTKPRS